MPKTKIKSHKEDVRSKITQAVEKLAQFAKKSQEQYTEAS